MVNDTSPSNDSTREDELLNRLVQASAQQAPGEITWPSADVILAYIKGQATEKQYEEVQSALAHSAEFRRFLVDTAEQVEAVASPEAIAEFDSVRVPKTMRPTKPKEGETLIDRLRRRLLTLSRPPVLVPAVSAIAVVVIALTLDPLSLLTPQPQTFALHSEVDSSHFVSLALRGGPDNGGIVKAAPSAFEAALNAMRGCVSYDLTTGAYDMQDGESHIRPEDAPRTLTLSLIDDAGNELGRIAGQAPISRVAMDSPIEAWIILPPSMRLWHLAMPEDSLVIEWQSAMGSRGCVTFTYRVDDGFLATPCRIFEL